MSKLAGILLFLLGAILLAGVWYANSSYRTTTRTFSPYTLLSSSWEKYKQGFLNNDGRVTDPALGDVTTSEGQSYALLRAVWVDDRETFDRVWQWTKNTLKRKDSNLFGWKWGKRPDGTYGYLGGGGDNSASDADSDIALALILASRRWRDVEYLRQVNGILKDIWDKETVLIAGKRYLIAGEWAKSPTEAVINPSYFSPYSWRMFASVDETHDWKSMTGPAYELLTQSGQDPLGGGAAAGLPPDWLAMDRKTGALKAPPPPLTANYSYDAMRIPWRIALDYQWFHDPQAQQYLASLSSLARLYTSRGKLVATYSHAGEPLTAEESPAMYATSLGYFLTERPDLAKRIYAGKIINLYSNDTNSFIRQLNYYDQNWFWFASGLYNSRLARF